MGYSSLGLRAARNGARISLISLATVKRVLHAYHVEWCFALKLGSAPQFVSPRRVGPPCYSITLPQFVALAKEYTITHAHAVPQVYAASIMFGYFVRRVDKRFQLERGLGLLSKGSSSEAVSRLERLFSQVRLPEPSEVALQSLSGSFIEPAVKKRGT